MFGPFFNGDSSKPFITRAPFLEEENPMGSIADRFHNVSQQTFRAAINSQEALKELRKAVAAHLAEIDALLPAKVPPVAETEWLPKGSNVHGIGPDTDGGPNPDYKGA
jgi:hypothetical protein